jgi:hypothetical protein
MKPTKLKSYLAYAVPKNYPVLIKGKPGIGKTDIIEAAALEAKAELIVSHPVVSDPTDFKGLPFASKDGLSADFLPYGDLNRLTKAKKKTVFFLDDLGQAPAVVQAACMQLLLARKINGHAVSDHVTFVAATNRREDKAGVSGILEPVKSRFMTILNLEVDVDDWVRWAIGADMPAELTSFVRFKPNVLEGGPASKDIENTSCPRTLAHVGIQQNNGLPEELYPEVFAGAAGPAFAIEYMTFMKMVKQLPSLDSIIADPDKAKVVKEPSINYAIIGGLARKMDDQTIAPIVRYLDRLQPEFNVACMTDGASRNPSVCKNKAYIAWASKHNHILAA